MEMYLFLNSNGPTRVSIVAKTMNMHKMQAYRQLEKMERCGFVFRTFGSPRLYSSVPIERLIRTKMHELKLAYESIEICSNQIIENLRQIRSMNTHSIDRMETIQGAERTQLAIFEMLKRTSIDFCGMNTLEYYSKLFSLRMASWPNNETKEFKKRVKVRGIVHLPVDSIKSNSSASKFIEKVTTMDAFIEFRFLKMDINPIPVFAVRDTEELVLITNEGEESEDFKNISRSAIWTTNKRLVVLVKIFFENLWEKSTKLQT